MTGLTGTMVQGLDLHHPRNRTRSGSLQITTVHCTKGIFIWLGLSLITMEVAWFCDSSRILFSRSTDAGLTWMNAIKSSVTKAAIVSTKIIQLREPFRQLGPNGEVYVS